MEDRNWKLSPSQPAILRTETAAYFTVWLDELTIKTEPAQGMWDLSQNSCTQMTRTNITGSFYISLPALEMILHNPFDLTFNESSSYCIEIKGGWITQTHQFGWHPETRKVSFVALSAEAVKNTDQVLLNPEPLPSVEFLDRAPSLVKKKLRPKGRAARVLKIARRKNGD